MATCENPPGGRQCYEWSEEIGRYRSIDECLSLEELSVVFMALGPEKTLYNSREYLISFTMVKILRWGESGEYKTVDGIRVLETVAVNADGSMPVTALLSFEVMRALSATMKDVKDAVDLKGKSGKKRFECWPRNPGARAVTYLVKCIQGHSTRICDQMEFDKVYEPVDPSHPKWCDTVVHGTFGHAVAEIWKKGLIPGGDTRGENRRGHVMCAPEVMAGKLVEG